MNFSFSRYFLSLRLGKTYLKVLKMGLRSPGKFPFLRMAEIYFKRSVLGRNLSFSGNFPFLRRKNYFCKEPWVGVFSIETNQDVTLCPCFLKMKIGNLNEAPIQEIWNAEALVQIRRSFKKGRLPKVCQNQLCPVTLNKEL